MNTSYHSIAGGLFVLLLVGSLSGPTAPAASDLTLFLSTPGPTLSEHLRAELRSKDATRKEHALIDIVALSQCSDACTVQLSSLPMKTIRIDNDRGVGSLIDLTALTPDLTRIYRMGPTDEFRILTLSALLNIGHEKSLDVLITDVDSVSPRVQKITHGGLSTFFLTKYPELNGRVSRSGTLSLDDIQIARAHAERQMRIQARRG